MSPLPPTERFTVVDPAPAKGGYTEFTELARRLEVPWAGFPTLTVRLAGARLSFSLDINSGSVVGVDVVLELEGPPGRALEPSLSLRREWKGDVEGKRRGISREAQTGDSAFDQAVYVEGTAPEDEARRLLARPEARGAVLSLLVDQKARTVEVTPVHVRARLPVASAFPTPETLVAVAVSLATLARGGGPRGPVAPVRGWWLPGTLAIGFFAAFASTIVLTSVGSVPVSLWLLGVLAGVVVTLAVRPVLAGLVRGDPRSFSRYQLSAWLLGLDLALSLGSLGVWANATFDVAPAVVVGGTARTVGEEDSESGTCPVTIDWDDRSSDEYSLYPPIAVGARLTERRHPGRLHFAWTERPQLSP